MELRSNRLYGIDQKKKKKENKERKGLDSSLGFTPVLTSPGSLLSPPHQVAIRRRPTLYVINLLVPSSFLVAIDALSFYLPAESENRAPFKMTLLLGYNVFLLNISDLLPATGTSLFSMSPTSQSGNEK